MSLWTQQEWYILRWLARIVSLLPAVIPFYGLKSVNKTQNNRLRLIYMVINHTFAWVNNHIIGCLPTSKGVICY